MTSMETIEAERAHRSRELRVMRAERRAFEALVARGAYESPPRALIRAGRTFAEVSVREAGRVALVAECAGGEVELLWRGRCLAGELVRLPIPPSLHRVAATWAPPDAEPRRALVTILKEAGDVDIADVPGTER